MVNLVLIVDCSEHILPYKQLYINTINNFIKAILSINPEILLTIAFYNTKSTFYCMNTYVKDIKPITNDNFIPQHKSYYYDSTIQIGHKLERMFNLNNQPMPLVFILCNSCEDNGHVDARLSALQIAIEKSKGWGFIFSGGSDNAIEMAQRLNYQFIYRYHNTEESLKKFVEHSQKTLSDALLSSYMSNISLENKEI